MGVEKINVRDYATNAKYPDHKNLCMDDWDTCDCVYKEKTYFDSEKGFIDYDVVIQRLSDGRYFKFSYTQYGNSGSDILDQTAYEVERKEKVETIVYYV